VNKELREKFDIFMALFNELEGLLRKVYVPQEGKSIMLMYINDIPEPYSSKMNTIRCARNVYVHGVKFDDEPLIQINDEVIAFLKGRIADVKDRIERLSKEKPIEVQNAPITEDGKFEFRERSLSNDESINQIKEVYGWYGWEYVGCDGLDDLDCKPTMKFRRDTTMKGYKALSSLWEQRKEKFEQYDQVRAKKKDSKKPFNKAKKKILALAGAFLGVCVMMFIWWLIITQIKDVVWMMVAMIGAVILTTAIIPYVVSIFNRDKARIKDKNGKTIYKDEYELAKEIGALDTQAKNIWEYLK
jgi:low affinity Fe/Cu permease